MKILPRIVASWMYPKTTDRLSSPAPPREETLSFVWYYISPKLDQEALKEFRDRDFTEAQEISILLCENTVFRRFGRTVVIGTLFILGYHKFPHFQERLGTLAKPGMIVFAACFTLVAVYTTLISIAVANFWRRRSEKAGLLD